MSQGTPVQIISPNVTVTTSAESGVVGTLASSPTAPNAGVGTQPPTTPPATKPEVFTVEASPEVKLEEIPLEGANAAEEKPTVDNEAFAKIFQVLADKYNEALEAPTGQATVDKFKLTKSDVDGMNAALMALEGKYHMLGSAGNYVPEILAASVFGTVIAKILLGLRWKRGAAAQRREEQGFQPPQPGGLFKPKPAPSELLSQEEVDRIAKDYWRTP